MISPSFSSLLGNGIFFLFGSLSSNGHSCVLTLFFVLHTTFILRKLIPGPLDRFFCSLQKLAVILSLNNHVVILGLRESRLTVVLQEFCSSHKLHSCFYNSTETRKMALCFFFKVIQQGKAGLIISVMTALSEISVLYNLFVVFLTSSFT